MRYVLMSIALAVATAAEAGAVPEPQTIAAECTTKPTGLDGVRYSCESQTARLAAPEGFVFAVNTADGGETSGAGSEHECELGWSDWQEVIPGSEIEQPRVVMLSSHARGPKGHNSGAGWAKCSFTIKLSKFVRN